MSERERRNEALILDKLRSGFNREREREREKERERGFA